MLWGSILNLNLTKGELKVNSSEVGPSNSICQNPPFKSITEKNSFPSNLHIILFTEDII